MHPAQPEARPVSSPLGKVLSGCVCRRFPGGRAPRIRGHEPTHWPSQCSSCGVPRTPCAPLLQLPSPLGMTEPELLPGTCGSYRHPPSSCSGRLATRVWEDLLRSGHCATSAWRCVCVCGGGHSVRRIVHESLSDCIYAASFGGGGSLLPFSLSCKWLLKHTRLEQSRASFRLLSAKIW